MILDKSQQSILKTFIQGNPDYNRLPPTADGAIDVSKDLATVFEPGYIVWTTELSERELMDSFSPKSTNWNWLAYISLSFSQQGAWVAMFKDGFVDYSKPNVRDGINEIFKGGGKAGAGQQAHIAEQAKILANKLEQLFSVGGGTDASPSTMEIVGSISSREIQTIMGW